MMAAAEATRDYTTEDIEPMLKEINLEQWELQLKPSIKDMSDLPTEGKNLIIVANLANLLHVRMFDSNGEKVVDKDNFPDKITQIKNLLDKLESLWPKDVLSKEEKDEVIAAVRSLVGHKDRFHKPYVPAYAARRVFENLQKILNKQQQNSDSKEPNPANGLPPNNICIKKPPTIPIGMMIWRSPGKIE